METRLAHDGSIRSEIVFMAYRKSEPFEGKAFPLEVYEAPASGELIEAHWHEHLEFIEVLEGSPLVRLGEREFRAAPGEILFAGPGQVHGARVGPGDSGRTRALVFDRFFVTNLTEGFETRRLFALLADPGALEVRHAPGEPLWADLKAGFDGIAGEMARREAGFELIVKAHLYRMMGLLLRSARPRPYLPAEPRPLAADFDRIRPLLAWVDESHAGEIGTREAAARAAMSMEAFCRFWKRATGLTFTEYLNRVRVDHAARLLLDADLSVEAIREAAGFRNSGYFNRVFRRLKGDSPLAWRKAALAG
jgi:AraC-like DNA-binding protein/quercetin dioxygenase-like cupin family protein